MAPISDAWSDPEPSRCDDGSNANWGDRPAMSSELARSSVDSGVKTRRPTAQDNAAGMAMISGSLQAIDTGFAA
ncbi:hypothetical protein ACWIGM_29100 [Bosea sp. NPDC055332]